MALAGLYFERNRQPEAKHLLDQVGSGLKRIILTAIALLQISI